MTLKLVNVVKDSKMAPALRAFAVSDHSEEQVDFIADKTTDPKKLFEKWLSTSAANQVNIDSPTFKQLDKLYKEKKYSDMTPLIVKAKKTVSDAFDKDVMLRFEASPAYALLNPEAIKTKAGLLAMGKTMSENRTFFTTAIANVKSKGKPADRIEVNRMFESGRMRHDKVSEWFTERLQKDKSFTRENHRTLFENKDTFSKLWAEYRKLLGR